MIITDDIKVSLLNHRAVPPDRERVPFLHADPSSASHLKSHPSHLFAAPGAAKITAIIGTRNEEHKIATALTHCLLWADEVIVVDKDSNDRTPEIARSMGARYVNAGFSRQGHESVEEQVSHATHDWVWIWTSHEVPSPELIASARRLVSDDVDLILVPMYYYSFGVHHDQSPWAGGFQPRLFNRRRVTFTGIAHDPLRAERIARIGVQPGVLHQTHAPVERFLLSHLDYAVNEAAQDTPDRILAQALHRVNACDRVFASDPALMGQQLGWKIYWLTVALHAWERMNPGIAQQYAARCTEALKDWQA